MAGLTLADAEERLAGWLTADSDLQNGQIVKYNDRTLTRADALEIRNNIDYWQKKCQELASSESGRGRSRTVQAGW